MSTLLSRAFVSTWFRKLTWNARVSCMVASIQVKCVVIVNEFQTHRALRDYYSDFLLCEHDVNRLPSQCQ
jgi:hypothetical protein